MTMHCIFHGDTLPIPNDGNPYSPRIRIPGILQLKHSAIFVQSRKKENLDSGIPQLEDSGNPAVYGIGRWAE